MTDEERRSKRAATQAKYYAANRRSLIEKQRVRDRERRYGLSQDQLNDLLRKQDFKCAICLSSEADTRGSFHVDHCHTTEVVRGLLCHHCNVGLGHFRDNETTLQRALDYLRAAKELLH